MVRWPLRRETSAANWFDKIVASEQTVSLKYLAFQELCLPVTFGYFRTFDILGMSYVSQS